MSAKDRILKAASEIAATEGVLSLGIDNVNRRAGVSKGAFFYHFKSKEEMVLAMVESVIEAYDNRLKARLDEGAPILEAMIDVSIAEVRERGALIGSLVAAVSIDPALGKKAIEHTKCWHDRTCRQSGLGPRAAALLRLQIDGLFMSTIVKTTVGSDEEFAVLREVILESVRSCTEAS